MSLRSKISLFLLLTFVLCPTGSQAQTCVNGPYESNTELLKSFNQTQSPLKQAYLQFKAAKSESGVTAPCNCSSDLSPPTELGSQLFRPAKMEKSCIAASLHRLAGQTAYSCSYPKNLTNPTSDSRQSVLKPLGMVEGKNNQCVTDDYIDYLHFAVNLAAECLSANAPVDAQSLFTKINNETGFNVSLAYVGGVGMMQITGICAEELTTDKGNGKYVFEEVAKSSNKACEPFRAIAAKDLQKSPSTSKNNYCAWVGPGEGLTRSLLYGVAYQVHMRKTMVLPLALKQVPQLAENEAVLREMENVTYGRGGIKQLRWILQRFRFSSKSKAPAVMAAIRKDSPYIREIENKMKEILCIQKNIAMGEDCNKTKFSQAELAGNLCVDR